MRLVLSTSGAFLSSGGVVLSRFKGNGASISFWPSHWSRQLKIERICQMLSVMSFLPERQNKKNKTAAAAKETDEKEEKTSRSWHPIKVKNQIQSTVSPWNIQTPGSRPMHLLARVCPPSRPEINSLTLSLDSINVILGVFKPILNMGSAATKVRLRTVFIIRHVHFIWWCGEV